MKKVVFDIETSNIFSEVGSNDPAALDISVVGIYEYEDDCFKTFTQDELQLLWPILEKADILIGYNSDHFDIPLLNKYYPGDLTKIHSVDIMKTIKDSYGRRVKLDDIAAGTLGTNKSSHGLQATEWWRAGEYEKVKKYCIDDVRITRDIYDFAKEYGELKLKNAESIVNIKLDTSGWEPKEKNAITHTLPF